jgi:hypothetical protein
VSKYEESVQDLKLMKQSKFRKSDVSTAMTALETLRKFADKGMVKAEHPQMVNAIR